MTAAPERSTADLIVDATLALAEERGWTDVRLFHVAARLDLPLARIFEHFRDLNAVADAWFDRAHIAMVAIPPDQIAGLAADRRLAVVTMRWFEALAPHREVTGQMLRGKLYPGHPHHWVPLVFDLSRHIHTMLDAARIASTGRARQLAEVGMTSIFLATLADWLRDGSDGQERTRQRLDARLALADRWLARLGRVRSEVGARGGDATE